MASEKIVKSHFMWFVLVLLTSPLMLSPVEGRSLGEVSDQKTYYSPDPHHHTSTPIPTIRKPACVNPIPSTPSTPSTPSQGTPPYHSGTPPNSSTPSHGDTPSTPSHGSVPSHDGTPSSPSHGGGGYYGSPTVPVITPPSVPITPTPLSPLTPFVPLTPPVFPLVPTPPTSRTPVPFDPNTPFPGTCDFWRTHPTLIWGILGYSGTMSGLFGPLATSSFGENLSFPEALSNTRTDGFGALFREGAASLLNSMVDNKFPLTTQQVRDAFMASLHSNHAAAAQAKVFKKANEGAPEALIRV